MKGKELIDFLRPYKRYPVYVNGHELTSADISIRRDRVDIERHCGTESSIVFEGDDYIDIEMKTALEALGPISDDEMKTMRTKRSKDGPLSRFKERWLRGT